LAGATIESHPGGKGANQALAARRLGADVRLVARVGDDPQAGEALAGLRDAGVDLGAVEVDHGAPTGVAVVTVADGGENHIVVASGVNARVGARDVASGTSDPDSAVLCQLELPDDAVVAASRLESALFCVNAAPARSLPAEVWQRADLVIVNEVEHEQLRDELAGIGGLLATTLGADGATLSQGRSEVAQSGPPDVDVIDTTGAGDAFSGALVVGLLEGRSHTDALARACAAGALATTRTGAQASLPTAAEIDKLLA